MIVAFRRRKGDSRAAWRVWRERAGWTLALSGDRVEPATTAEFSSPPSQPRDWTVHPVGQLFVRELVVVAHLAFETGELRLQRVRERLLSLLTVQIVQLERIVHEVIQFPLILLPEVDQLVSERANSIVRPRVVIA